MNGCHRPSVVRKMPDKACSFSGVTYSQQWRFSGAVVIAETTCGYPKSFMRFLDFHNDPAPAKPQRRRDDNTKPQNGCSLLRGERVYPEDRP